MSPGRIGIIGVGYIGQLFVDRLRETDYAVSVFDINDEQVSAAMEKGANAVDSPAAVGREADVIVMALPGSPEVEATMTSEDGLLAELDAGQSVIDVTTTHPETSIVCEELCSERDVQFIEAPITGAAPREGYHMMIGGTQANYEGTADVLDVLCDDHIRIGEVGKATVFKLGLQMRYAGHNALDAEIVAFAQDNGVDPTLFNEFLDMGMWEKYFTEDYSQDIEGLGGLAIWHKDIGYAREVARESGTALPLNGVVHEAYKATVRRIEDDEGHAAAVMKYWQMLNGGKESGNLASTN